MTPLDSDLAGAAEFQDVAHPTQLHLQFDSILSNVDYAAVAVRAWCELSKLPAEMAWQIELVVVEAITNIIVHAYANRPDRPIRLAWLQDAEQLLIEIRDRGKPLPAIPESDLPDPEAEAGRGWPIIRACADTVSYRRENKENILILGKSLGVG